MWKILTSTHSGHCLRWKDSRTMCWYTVHIRHLSYWCVKLLNSLVQFIDSLTHKCIDLQLAVILVLLNTKYRAWVAECMYHIYHPVAAAVLSCISSSRVAVNALICPAMIDGQQLHSDTGLTWDSGWLTLEWLVIKRYWQFHWLNGIRDFRPVCVKEKVIVNNCCNIWSQLDNDDMVNWIFFSLWMGNFCR